MLTLQQVGNVNYTGWILQVPCSTNRQIITELQNLAKIMEEQLRQWKLKVKSRREEFYELNYFNTMQLLTLRRELGKVYNSKGLRDVSPEVLALLHSISSQVIPKAVSEAVCEMMTEVQPVEEQPAEDSVEIEPQAPASVVLPASNSDLPQRAQPSLDMDNYNIMPRLTKEDLSDLQKQMMVTICSRLECSKLLVLKSFEDCPGEDNNQFDYERWCYDHIEMDDILDANEECKSDSEYDDSASGDSDDSEPEDRPFKHSIGRFIANYRSILRLLRG